MERRRAARQGNFLAQMEPGPMPTPAARATLIPLVAALLLGVMKAEMTLGVDAREAGDDQDHA